MAFSIQFGNTSDAPSVLHKNFDKKGTPKSCEPWQQVSMLTGTVVLRHYENLSQCNYAHITGDGRERYCYIRDISYGIGDTITITLEVDPLMTYYDEIIKQDIEVTRCSKQAYEGSMGGYNSMLRDPEIETTVQRSYREFPFKLTAGDMRFVYPSNQYILAVIG